MTAVRLPSVLLDLVEEDFLDATAATVEADAEGPYELNDGDELEIVVDGGAPQVIAFNDVDFDDIGAATPAEVVAVINAGLSGAVATLIDDGDRISISTTTMGSTGSVEVVSEPAGEPFEFATGEVEGEDATEQMLLFNRIPEPGETGVPLQSDLELEIHRHGGLAVAHDKIVVTVDDVVVLEDEIALEGWSVVFSEPGTSTVRVVLTPPAAFESDVLVDVFVEVDGVAWPGELYSFRTVDVVRPTMLSAVAQSRKVVRVTFSEAMLQEDPTASGDALNPTHYIVERATRPAVAVEVVSVEHVSATQVDLHLDIEMTFGAGYELVVTQVLDVAGNEIAPAPDNGVEFTGFLPAFPAGRHFVLANFLPAMNLAEDASGDLRMFLAVLQEVTNTILCDIDEWAKILDPDRAPEHFVDAMLQDLGNPFPFDLSEVDKRRLLRILVRLYLLKGTYWGVVDSIRFFTGLEVDVETYADTGWELTEGDDEVSGDELSDLNDSEDVAVLGPDQAGLYSFRIVTEVDLTDEQREQVRFLAEYMKVAHEHYLGTVEPTPAESLDHLVLDYSELGDDDAPGDWILH